MIDSPAAGAAWRRRLSRKSASKSLSNGLSVLWFSSDVRFIAKDHDSLSFFDTASASKE